MQILLDIIRDTHAHSQRDFTRGDHLYNWGDRSSHVFLIERGLVKSVRYAASGKPCLLNIDGAGDLLGLSFSINEFRRETAIAKSAVSVVSFGRDWLIQTLSDNQLESVMFDYLTNRIENQSHSLEYFITLDARQRLAAMLIKLAQSLGQERGASIVVDHQFTHEELAQLVGTTRSRVGLFLQEFEIAGLIRRRRGQIVIDHERIEDCLLDGSLLEPTSSVA